MKKDIVNNIIIYGFLLCFFVPLSAQSRKEIEQKKNQALKEISLTNRLLKDVRKSKRRSYNQFLIYNQRVSLRSQIIETLNSDIDFLNTRIADKENVIEILKHDIELKKKELGDLLYHVYLSGKHHNNFMFILSSESFNQAYKRLKYLNQLSEYRKTQLGILAQLNLTLNTEIENLKKQYDEKLVLLDHKQLEKHNLNVELDKKKDLLSTLRRKEKQYREDLKKKQRLANELDKELERLITAEAKKGTTKYFELTPEEQKLSNTFNSNKGVLPWPTKRGLVTSSFGRQGHPVIKGVYIDNNGINITTIQGSKVRAVFKGVVSKVFAIKGANYTVLIKHGDFFTVYQNLINVTVTKDQEVGTKDIVGEVFYNSEEDISNLHFELWKGLNRLDPEIWLARNK